MIAGLIQARINSERCPKKMIRSFADTTLLDIALSKFSKCSSKMKLYFAAYEKELLDIGKKYECTIIERSEKSAHSDSIQDVFDYLDNINESHIVFINGCSPFLRTETVNCSIDLFEEKKLDSLTAVIKKKTFFFHPNRNPVNMNIKDELNTKTAPFLYEMTHNLHIFNRLQLIHTGRFWNCKTDDPYPFEIDETEALDIDTELDFTKIESFYQRMNTA